MKNIEHALRNMGFNKLQDKEDFVYFEKSTSPNKQDMQQICIVYDKKNKRLKSMDTFHIRDERLELSPNDEQLTKNISKLLSS